MAAVLHALRRVEMSHKLTGAMTRGKNVIKYCISDVESAPLPCFTFDPIYLRYILFISVFGNIRYILLISIEFPTI